MKRHGNLYDQAFTHEALFAAYVDARKNKRATHSCYQFEKRLGGNLAALERELADGSYAVLPYNTFKVFEPKPRTIHAPAFRDRVVQHAIYRVIQPIFDASFIDQSFACRPGKGTHGAADYVQHALQQVPRDSYILQLDIRKFYYRIDRAILRGLIERKIKDARLVDLMMRFALHESPLGVPIGNLLSQLYALIYLNPMDHFIKRELGVKHYARYVDDFALIGLSRDEALAHRTAIVAFLADNLRLELSKSSIHRVSRGLNFVGYRTWATRRFVRKHALYNFRRAVRLGRAQSVVSSLGHARRTASFRAMCRHIKEHQHDLPVPASH
jgi:retron-type reverse transcriptase